MAGSYDLIVIGAGMGGVDAVVRSKQEMAKVGRAPLWLYVAAVGFTRVLFGASSSLRSRFPDCPPAASEEGECLALSAAP